MRANVGMLDRLIRLLVAVAAAVIFFTGERPAWEYAFLVIGAVLAVTALVGRCPLYRLFGFNTDRRNAPR